jgi:hypothetical protein
MSVVTTFNFDEKLSDLNSSYKTINTTSDILSFQFEVLKSLKILSYLLQ